MVERIWLCAFLSLDGLTSLNNITPRPPSSIDSRDTMSSDELQTFKDQLALVNLQLESEPENADLLQLKAEFNELIELTEAAQAAEAAKAAKSKEKKHRDATHVPKEESKANTNWQDQGEYRAGMDCMAKYKDGKW